MLAEGWWLTRTGRPRSEPEIRVDQVRDLVREIAGAPFEARRRVFVIDDAHTMNDAAQNALLKSLEEPAAALARDPGLVGGLRPAPHDPLPLPAAALRPAAAAARGRAPARASAASRRGRASCRPRSPGGSLAAALALESEASCACATSWSPSSSAWPAPTRSRAWKPRKRSSSPRTRRSLLTTLRSLLRDLAALRAGAAAEALLNPDAPSGCRRWRRARSGSARRRSPSEAEDAREALRGFASKLLTFDRLVNALAGD